MNEANQAGEVRKAIERAFAAPPPPDPRHLCHTYDDEGVSEYFAGRPWSGHKVDDLRYHECALAFLNGNAFRYYLPAFLLAILEDRERADVIVDRVWRLFCDRNDFSTLYLATPELLFDERERDGLAVFFRHESDVRTEFWDGPIEEHLAERGFEDLTTIEIQTTSILSNLNRCGPPETLLAHRLRLKLAAFLGISIDDNPG